MAQRWFLVTPEAIYELTSVGRVLRSWPGDGLFDELIVSGYPVTLLPVDLVGVSGVLDEDEEQIFFVDLAVCEARSRFTVIVCIPGPVPREAPMPADVAAVFEDWYRLHAFRA